MAYKILLFIVIASHPLLAANTDRLIPVFRSTTSQFASDEISLSVLKRGLTKTSASQWWEIETLDGRRGYIPGSQIKSAHEFASQSSQGEPSKFNLTHGLAREGTTLHALPDTESKTVRTLAAGDQFEILNMAIPKNPDENWVRVKFGKSLGFVDLRDALTALDLISSIELKNGETRKILYALSGWVFSQAGERYGVADIQSADWKSQAIVTSLSSIKTSTKPSAPKVTELSPGSRVQLVRPVQQLWGASFVPRLGLMMWTDDDLTPPLLPNETLTTERIFERHLYDMATHPTRNSLRVASAKGIFITQDGQAWRQLKDFGDENHSVLFTPSGYLIVGDRISTDAGQSFQPLVKWDEVTPIIKSKIRRVPSWMRITGIHSRQEEISVEVEVGKASSVNLRSADLGLSWSLVR